MSTSATTRPDGQPPAGLEHKSAVGAGTVDVVDGDEGVVEAIVSVTGVQDRVNDVIHPGAYVGSPIGVWSHDDKMWASRTEDSAELPPGDPRLPATTRGGRPWPKDAGGLWVRTRYNLDTRVGRDAYSNVKFFKDATGWSIGYRVPPGGSYMRNGVRHITKCEVWEYSPVMVGAADEPMTLSVKTGMADPVDEPDLDMGLPDSDNEGVPPELLEEALADIPADTGETAADGDVWADLVDDTRPPGVPADETTPTDLADDAEVKKQYSDQHRADLAARGHALTDGSFPIADKADLGNAVKAFGRAKDQAAAKRHIIKRARALGATELLPDGWLTGETSPAAEVKAAAKCKYDGDPATQIVTGGKADIAVCDKHLAMAKRAVKMGGGTPKAEPVGKSSDDDGGKPAEKALPRPSSTVDATVRGEVKYDTSPLGEPGGRQNWVDKAGGFPPFLRAVAHALQRERGKSESQAIQIAKGAMERWAAGGGDVSAETRAKAAEVLTWWETHTGGGSKGLLDGWDPAAEVGPDAAWLTAEDTPAPVEVKAFPFINGSYEAASALLRQAVWEQFRGEPLDDDEEDADEEEPIAGSDTTVAEPATDTGTYSEVKTLPRWASGHYDDEAEQWEWPLVAVVGTWPDRAVVTRCRWDDGRETRETYEVPYTITADQVELGEPTPVQLRVDAAPIAEPAADAGVPTPLEAAAAPVAGVVDQTTAGLKLLLPGRETKAGRVLSGMNAGRLRDAVQRLLEVLAEAGVAVEPPAAAPPAGLDEEIKSGVLLDPADYTRGLRLRASL